MTKRKDHGLKKTLQTYPRYQLKTNRFVKVLFVDPKKACMHCVLTLV